MKEEAARKHEVERILREFRKECGPGFEAVPALYAEYRLGFSISRLVITR